MIEWQPIETADTTDTRDVLLWCPRGGVTRGCWEAQIFHKRPKPYWRTERWGRDHISWDRYDAPTHWAPLPEGPQA